jgi:hypothetical protein
MRKNFQAEILKVRDHLEDVGVDGRIILKLDLEEFRWWLGQGPVCVSLL